MNKTDFEFCFNMTNRPLPLFCGSGYIPFFAAESISLMRFQLVDFVGAGGTVHGSFTIWLLTIAFLLVNVGYRRLLREKSFRTYPVVLLANFASPYVFPKTSLIFSQNEIPKNLYVVRKTRFRSF